jgi:hypothetical protein
VVKCHCFRTENKQMLSSLNERYISNVFNKLDVEQRLLNSSAWVESVETVEMAQQKGVNNPSPTSSEVIT